MAKEMKYRDVLKDKEFCKHLFFGLINRFGDSLDAIAFTWITYQITHSASWAALMYGLNVIPNIIVQPLAGPIVERLDKKKVIVSTHILRGLVISAFVIMYLTGIVNPLIMAAFTLVITTIESFNMPAAGAFTPLLVQKEKLAHAMSLRSTLDSVVQLVGTGVAGVIIAKLGAQTAMMIDAATFFTAAFGIMTVRTLAEREADSDVSSSETVYAAKENLTQKDVSAKQSYFSMLQDGLSYVFKNRIILNVCLAVVLMNLFLVPLNALQAPIAEEIYGLGSELLSVIGIAAAIGGIIGSIIIPGIMDKFSVKSIIVVGGVTLGGFMYLLSRGSILGGAVIPGYLWAGTCFFMMVVAGTVIGGSINIQFVKTCDAQYLARAGSVLGALSVAATPVGSFVVSALSVKLSPAFMLGAGGIMLAAIGIIAAVSKIDFEIIKKDETVPNATQTI